MTEILREALKLMGSIPKPITVNRDGMPTTLITPPTQELSSVFRAAKTRGVKNELLLDRAMPGYSVLINRVWSSMADRNIEGRSGTTVLREAMDGLSGGGTYVCGLPTGVNGVKILPRMVDAPLDLQKSLLSAIELQAWLSGVLRGEVGALTNDAWDISVIPDSDEHVLATALPSDVDGLQLHVRHKPTSSVCTVELWIKVFKHQPSVLHDVTVTEVPPVIATPAWYGADVVMSALQRCILCGDLRPATAALLYNGERAKTLQKRRGWGEGADTHHMFGDTTAPPERVLTQRVDVAHYNVVTGVSHGRIAAGDVGPALVVYSGHNGGKAIVAGALSVYSEADGYIYTHASTDLAKMHKATFFHESRKHAPCVRDGLLAAYLVAGLQGDGEGRVQLCVVNGPVFAAKTIWYDLLRKVTEPGSGAAVYDTIYTRDPMPAYRSLIATALMQPDWSVEANDTDGSAVVSVKRNNVEYTMEVAVRHGPSIVPRWADVLSVDETAVTDWYDCSELGLDYWCSGLARYILRDHIRYGKVSLSGKLSVPASNVFHSLLVKMGRGTATVTDYIVDLERFNKKIDGAGYSYVYAIGVVKVRGGECIGSSLIVDDNPDLEEMINTATLNDEHRLNAATLHNSGARRGVAGDYLDRLRDVVKANPSVRVFGKGVDDDDATMQGDHNLSTRLFKRKNVHPDAREIRELGSLMERVEGLAAKQGWPTTHNPAAEAMLFAHAAGMVNTLPAYGDVGQDTMESVLTL